MLLPNGKPAAVQAAGFQNIDRLCGKFDVLEDSLPPLVFQAFRVQRHQPGISLSAALAVAELHWRSA
ncbi:hypothetical protein ABMA59_23675 [Mesorhizobium sp. CN2-181]